MGESFSDRLWIAAPQAVAAKLSELLASAQIQPSGIVCTGSEAVSAAKDGALLLTTYRLPDMTGEELAKLLGDDADVLMIVPQDYEGMDSENVMMLRNPISQDALVQAVRTLAHCRARMQLLRQKAQKLSRTLEDRKIIDRAKGRLMDTLHITEAEAHYHIQKKSMDSGRRIADVAQDILSDKGNGTVTILYDLRSSWAVRECIKENGGRPLMSRVGHAFIKQQMRENNAVFAGELSGHYYFSENYVAESQGLALIKLANLICKTGKKVSELVKPLRKYFASGEINSKVADTKVILDKIRKKYSDGHMFELDGISVEYSDWWFNVRASNTEPLLRLIVEAKDKATMEAKRDELLALIRG